MKRKTILFIIGIVIISLIIIFPQEYKEITRKLLMGLIKDLLPI